MPEGEFFNYVVEDYPVRFVVLDSYFPGRAGGQLCQRRLKWLDDVLAHDSQRPTCVMLHHAPFESGNIPFDRELLIGREAFEEIVRKHKNIHRVLCGHLHRATLTAFAGTIACSAPSVSVQTVLKTAKDAVFEQTKEPPAFAYHRLMDNGSMVTSFFSLP